MEIDGAGLRRREAVQIREGRRGGINENFNLLRSDSKRLRGMAGVAGRLDTLRARWRKKGTLDYFFSMHKQPQLDLCGNTCFGLLSYCTNAAASFFSDLCIGTEEGTMNVGKIL